jgi:hypothetical protein
LGIAALSLGKGGFASHFPLLIAGLGIPGIVMVIPFVHLLKSLETFAQDVPFTKEERSYSIRTKMLASLALNTAGSLLTLSALSLSFLPRAAAGDELRPLLIETGAVLIIMLALTFLNSPSP